jgi:hypothetical protein
MYLFDIASIAATCVTTAVAAVVPSAHAAIPALTALPNGLSIGRSMAVMRASVGIFNE